MKNRVCSKCGTENEIDARFCKGCGSMLSDEESQITDQAPKQKRESVDQTPKEDQETADQIPVEEIEFIGEEPPKPAKKKKRKWWLMPVIVVVAIVIIAALGGTSKPSVTSIQSTYTGETEAGVVLDKGNDGIQVIGITEDGEKVELSGWTIEEPKTLEADSTASVIIQYKELQDNLVVTCSTSAVTGITAQYKGYTEEGVVIDENSDFIVQEVHKNGNKTKTKDWTLKAPATLKADEIAKVTIQSGEFSTEVEIECSTVTLTGISATYSGSKKEGVVLDSSNSDITVIGEYKNGTTKEVTGFEVVEAATLQASQTSTVTIRYEDQECTLEVACSTIDPQVYKDSCESIAYEKLARNPDAYEGKNVKFTGKVVQTMEGGSMGALRVNVTKGRYSYDDTVYVLYEIDQSNRVLEDDIVTFYGYSMGLYSYESVMGATITIPEVLAAYVEVN